eukprot:gnl/TRDRNA2_/TRDRNA2_145943_c0_seq1.p1 gnl/TRDRNA2_/TRDRNA2_145943_c0~~gnl/TRDRNA2_/TRDRNA2_145943_c0_seq1.p1  ORF type:complete len:439 (+),score=63.83 gnl/TRDRNA2_/TRDRNA2_145943_c0_seq1:43-1359(+)
MEIPMPNLSLSLAERLLQKKLSGSHNGRLRQTLTVISAFIGLCTAVLLILCCRDLGQQHGAFEELALLWSSAQGQRFQSPIRVRFVQPARTQKLTDAKRAWQAFRPSTTSKSVAAVSEGANAAGLDTLLSNSAVSGIRNFRAVNKCSAAPLLFRSATLDEISLEAAEELLLDQSRPLGAIIDLRNPDEIAKGKAVRTEGARHLYSQLGAAVAVVGLTPGGKPQLSKSATLYHAPLFGDVAKFWDGVEARMPPSTLIPARLAAVFDGDALNRAAGRHLEDGGQALLYTVVLDTAPAAIVGALRVCLEQARLGRRTIFHCQKGKDRTGVVAMLIESVLGDSDEAIVTSYSVSGSLLGGADDPSNNARAIKIAASGNADAGSVDWSRLNGSPSQAMRDTLAYVRAKYGSIESYLDSVGFREEERTELRALCGGGEKGVRNG